MENARFYYVYNNILVKILRVFLFVVIFALIFVIYQNTKLQFSSLYNYKLVLFLSSFFLMFELFFDFKIAKTKPKLKISQNNGKEILKSLTLNALSFFVSSENSTDLINLIKNRSSQQFILEKADILKKDFKVAQQLNKEDLIKYAFEIAKTTKGTYVTTMDIFAAYILLTEDKTKLLFNKKLKKEEFLHILYWAKTVFTTEENPQKIKVNIWGEGMAEEWVSGWTLETKKYALDLTSEILKNKPQSFGRDKEYNMLLEAMHKGKSAILVGEAGAGKESLAKTLAYESFQGNLKGSLYHRRFYQLMVDAFLAGAQNQGELEARLDNIISELSHSGNIIIFIPNIENIFGSSSFKLDLSGALLPYLEKGAIRIVSTATQGAYKKFIQPIKLISEAFDVIQVNEPDKDLALLMLFNAVSLIEKEVGIKITYRATIAAFNFCAKYAKDEIMPGSAVLLLKDTASSLKLSGKKNVEEEDIFNQVERKTKIAVSFPKDREKELLLNLEGEIHKRLIDQEEAVSAISEAMRRLRTGLTDKKKPVSFLFLGPTGVGKTETAKTLAALYYGSQDSMIRLDMSEYSSEDGEKRLLGALPGEEGQGELTDKIYDNPSSLVLLDEFEKANPKILDLFLQVLDDGRLTDNKGRTVSFIDSIIIATSNAASEFIREEVKNKTSLNKNFQPTLLDFLQSKGIFKPELLNRFDGIIVFKPLGENEVLQITKLLLSEFAKKMEEKDILINFDESVVGKIAKEGFDEQFGARPLKRFIQDNIEDLIAQKILKEEISRGDKMLISTDSNGGLLVNKA